MKDITNYKNKIVLLENGQMAKVLTIIIENYEICMIVGKLNSDTILIWDNQGKSENSDYNIDRFSTESLHKNG